MRINSRHLALIAVAAGTIAPTSALAAPNAGTDNHGTAAVAPCTKDYSRDSVTGGYCPSDGIGVGAVSVPTPAPTTIVKHDDGGFSWSDAGAGAGGAIALIAVATGGAIAFRRRNPSVDPRRSAATS